MTLITARSVTCLIWLILIVSLVVMPGTVHAKKSVFIVASYEEGHICGGPQEEGVLKGLAGEGYVEGQNLLVERYYMDTKRNNTTKELMKQQGKAALEQIQAVKPDVVVVIDDNAFREVGIPLAGRDDLSVVYTGMNGQLENYNKIKHIVDSREHPGGNVTGVYEKLYVERSLRVLKAIPGITGNTFVFISDYTPTGIGVSAQFDQELATPLPGLKYRFVKVREWAEYKKLIKEISADDSVAGIYPAALSFLMDDGSTNTAADVFAWTIANCNKPGMAVNYFFAKLGLFGGAAVDFKDMGALAGIKAGQILNGAKAGELPIEDAPEYAIVFNITRAEQLGIEIPSSLLTAADYVYK